MTTVISPEAITRAEAGPPAVPAEYAKAAAAKLKRDRQSYAEFRAADQREHERLHEQYVTAAVKSAEGSVRGQRENVCALEEWAAEQLAAFRSAEDKARGAAEYSRLQREAYERVKGQPGILAEEETRLLLAADAADETAFQAEQARKAAEEDSAAADQDLGVFREALAKAERALDRARAQAEVPAGTAPVSEVTMKACAGYMQSDEVWDSLSDRDKFRVRQAGEPRPMKTMDQFWADFREACAAAGVT